MVGWTVQQMVDPSGLVKVTMLAVVSEMMSVRLSALTSAHRLAGQMVRSKVLLKVAHWVH